MTGLSLRFSEPNKSIGEIIGKKYRLSKLIGKGGMGFVYEAVNVQLDKKVAIKVLLPESSKIDQVTERFKREARSAASIGHENIVDVYDLDTTDDGIVFIVMELLVGYDFAHALDSTGAVPVERAATICVQSARALGAAHERGIIHRDLKPENIFLVQRKTGEVVKIVDFGIAMIKEHGSITRLTTDGILLGTPYYMSPEQARGAKDLDHRVDIYALGAVMFEALTGSVLFAGETYLEVISKHQMQPPPILQERKPDLVCPRPVEDLIMKMLEKDPGKRPSSMEEVEKVLLPYSSERASARISEISGKSDAFADTAVGTGSMTPAPQKMHTTPVQWEEGEGPGRIRGLMPVFLIGGGVVFLAMIIVGALFLFSGGKEGESTDPKSFPISSMPVKTQDKTGKQKAQENISIAVSASPQEAVIKINGSIIEGNPAELNLLRSSDTATITIEAEGYATQEQEIKLDRSHTISYALEKIPREKDPSKKTKKPDKKETAPDIEEPKGKKTKKPDKIIDTSPYKTGVGQ
ncbi:MAG: serine/threonine-protein kinase [Pseudomonadota bacterium]